MGSRRLVKKSKMKNCEVVIIVVSVLNSSNFSKKNPGIISGYPEIKKTYSSSGEKKKNTDGFLAAYLLTLARERCARHLVMPKKKLKIICEKIFAKQICRNS